MFWKHWYKKRYKKQYNNNFIITGTFRYEVGVMLVRFMVNGVENFGIRVIEGHNGFNDIGFSKDYLFIRDTYKQMVDRNWRAIQQTNFENKLLARIS